MAVSANAAMLPSFPATADSDSNLKTAKWWAQVGDKVYVAPPSLLQLSDKVSDYYYALGSESALTMEMRRHRVGGEGRWHIFHLPEGPSMLQLSSRGGRRATLSSLMQLRHGDVLAAQFPEYHMSPNYTHPGSSAVQKEERAVALKITEDSFNDYLTKLVALPNGQQTRSYSNVEATKAAESFVQEAFKAMNMTTCLQNFQENLANVIAYIPGTSTDTVTVGAHFDSRPFYGKAPGAEDNGSGVAAMLAAAKAFTEAKMKPVKTLYFVGFAAEEAGLVGSTAFVKDLKSSQLPAECQPKQSFLQSRRSPPQHAAIILDEVGWKSPKLTMPTVNLESKDSTKVVMDHLANANTALNGVAVKLIHNSAPFGSDHMSFLDKGMAAVLVINADDDKYPHYHSSTDTLENVNSEYAVNVSRMVFGGMLRLAGLRDA